MSASRGRTISSVTRCANCGCSLIGGVKSLKWNQQDSGQQVKEGNYTASTSTGSVNASTTFAIVK
ncbi:MAG TPA: hypothetical protein VF884_10440 [Nitrososphaeraceae archaeon]